MILPRRSFLLGAAASLIAAPAIVRAASLMPVKQMRTVEDIYALLAERINEAHRLMAESLSRTLYGETYAVALSAPYGNELALRIISNSDVFVSEAKCARR